MTLIVWEVSTDLNLSAKGVQCLSTSMFWMLNLWWLNWTVVYLVSRALCYRLLINGGMSLPNRELFDRIVFLEPISNVLIDPESSDRPILPYLMAFPHRKHLPSIYTDNAVPHAVIKRPSYIEEPVFHIKNLKDSGIFIPVMNFVHRYLYYHWISEIWAPRKSKLKTSTWTRTLFWNSLQPFLLTSKKPWLPCTFSTCDYSWQGPDLIGFNYITQTAVLNANKMQRPMSIWCYVTPVETTLARL